MCTCTCIKKYRVSTFFHRSMCVYTYIHTFIHYQQYPGFTITILFHHHCYLILYIPTQPRFFVFRQDPVERHKNRCLWAYFCRCFFCLFWLHDPQEFHTLLNSLCNLPSATGERSGVSQTAA